MRIKGRLTSWNDDRGFGFIAPIEGDQEVFVHIKAFGPRSGRPQVNEVLWYEVELGPQGKKRAKNVEVVRRSTRNEEYYEPSAPRGAATLIVIPAFILLYVIVAIIWQPPLFLLGIYVVASFITYLVYAIDKLAARQGARRTHETTLHLLSIVGGWPGALLAQQRLRHKSIKLKFRRVFWTTVILNVAGFVLFCSPLGQQFWAPPQ